MTPDPIRVRLDEHHGDDWNAHVFAMDAALRAVLDLADYWNGGAERGGTTLHREEVRSMIADALGVTNDL